MQRIMNNKCLCASKTAKFCCPGDKKLRKAWLMDLEKEHDPLRQTSKEIVRKLKLLANSHRIEILLMLGQREHCMDEMARKLKAKKSAVSYHLMMLEKNGMICKIKRSRFAFYSLSRGGEKTLSLFRN
ncbi:MAG: transcriptional regulator, ArsR family [Candidatus Methanoperedens nitroreducens]|uniref:Transcriptional regulator, ArsR family n=2 Tax=Candidatus Methanoperedens TaxID=1392997 RepID=A0A0P8A857_9EURY|nr:MAG: winged helix-turn-helix transcriptional regulator [Candidatus Methanoperedens sp.]KPQ42836.1 MAG: transcriptional regulator, ArsR family [Candidatus Methanoperedens sp. BLZ1]